MIEIIAKGLLSSTETRIAFYIIRWSWGFEDRKNKRRQDWTQSKTVKEIAKDINLNYWWCAPVVKKMLEEEKLLKNKEGGWQFNEHYEKWKVKESLTVKENLSKEKLNPKLRNPSLQVKENLTQKYLKGNNNKKSRTPKETLKETLKEKKEISLSRIIKILKPVWNKYGTTKHSNAFWNNTIKEQLKIRLVDGYSLLQIAHMIKGYRIVYDSNLSWWSQKKSLDILLKRAKGGWIDSFSNVYLYGIENSEYINNPKRQQEEENEWSKVRKLT